MNECERIARYFAPLTNSEPGAFNLTDDTAVLTPPAGNQLVITTDSVIQGIHVMPDATPAQYAQKLLRRNLSDLAAMGATPWRYSLNLHTPRELPDKWFDSFAAALAAEQATFGIVMIGGDSTSGGNVIHTTMTCIGLLEGQPLRRNGATIDDDIYVSGTIGNAAVALALLKQKEPAPASLVEHYHLPQPRLELGQSLRHISTSCIDISDGLMADIVQLARASNVGASIHCEAIPCSPEVQQILHHNPLLWERVVAGGDDYELCFTASADQRDTIQSLANKLGIPLTRIGSITEVGDVMLLDKNGEPITLATTGWSH